MKIYTPAAKTEVSSPIWLQPKYEEKKALVNRPLRKQPTVILWHGILEPTTPCLHMSSRLVDV
jgi:hypothetical protein